MIKVLVVDDHPLVLEGVRNLLKKEENIELTGLCKNAVEAIASVKSEEPDIALLDINLPDINGIELCKKIKIEFPDVKSIALTTFSNPSYISKMIAAGALGYLLKNSSRREIVDAIKKVYNGEMSVHLNAPIENEYDQNREDRPALTPRELEVLNLISQGFTNGEIAEKLYVSVLTVNSHRKNLLRKFDTKNTATLIKDAMVYGLIED